MDLSPYFYYPLIRPCESSLSLNYRNTLSCRNSRRHHCPGCPEVFRLYFSKTFLCLQASLPDLGLGCLAVDYSKKRFRLVLVPLIHRFVARFLLGWLSGASYPLSRLLQADRYCLAPPIFYIYSICQIWDTCKELIELLRRWWLQRTEPNPSLCRLLLALLLLLPAPLQAERDCSQSTCLYPT